jgi:hypothetical protein
MKRRGDQRGAALVMIIGVIAALAVLAGALVFLIGNAQSNTSRDRSKTKAFNVAEAALDLALYKVGTDWPVTADAALGSTEKDTFLGGFAASEFPGKDVTITYFDNYDSNGDGSITRADGWPRDGNGSTRPGDGFIYIEAQATVGGQKARVQCLATRVFKNPSFPRGIAAAADANIATNSSKPSIGSDPANGGYMAADQTALTLMAGGTISNSNPNSTAYDPALFPASNVLAGQGAGVVDRVLDPDIVQFFITTAKKAGKFYSDIASEQSKTGIDKAKPLPNKNDIVPFEGIVVIETTTTKIELNGTGDYNGDGVGANEPPGVLMVIGPETMYPDDASKAGQRSPGIDLGGNGRYYGVMYTDGSIGGNGTITIVGMALAKGGITLAGNRRIEYNDNIVANLTRTVQISAQIVPNTWRQIQPL